MAYISKIKDSSNNINYLKYGIYPVIGTQTESTNVWTGTIDVPSLYDGLTIAYFLPYASISSNVTLNLTLNNGTTTGAIACYYTSTSRIKTHYGVGSVILLTYYSAGSISVDGTATTNARWLRCDYNSNTTYSVATTAANGLMSSTDKTKLNGLTSVMRYMGTKSTIADLPSSGNEQGDTWHVDVDGGEYSWNGSDWELLGKSIDTSNFLTGVASTKVSIGSASTETAISADDITAWTTNTPTQVTPATVVTGGGTSSIPNIAKKTVVVSGSTGTINEASSKTVVTGVTVNNVVTSGSTVSVTPVSSKNVVVSASTVAAAVGASTASITPITSKNVVVSGSTVSAVTGGSTTSITPVASKTVVTAATPSTASYSNGVLTFTFGNASTGASVTTSSSINVYTGITTGSVIGSVSTGASITTGTAVNVLTSLTTGSVIGSVSTGASITTSNAISVIGSLSTGAAASVTTGASITTSPVTVVKSLTTGDSVTEGTAIKAYTSLTTGPAATVTAGAAATLTYTSRSIPNISVTATTVVKEVAGTK